MVEQVFISAAQREVICEITDTAGRTRLIEPYIVYVTRAGKRMFHCFQTDGYSSSHNVVQWKNMEICTIRDVCATEKGFHQRVDYNPVNRGMFPTIVFAAAKRAAAV